MRVERVQMRLLLIAHVTDLVRRARRSQHRELAGVYPGGAIFAGMIDADHAMHRFIGRRIAR